MNRDLLVTQDVAGIAVAAAEAKPSIKMLNGNASRCFRTMRGRWRRMFHKRIFALTGR